MSEEAPIPETTPEPTYCELVARATEEAFAKMKSTDTTGRPPLDDAMALSVASEVLAAAGLPSEVKIERHQAKNLTILRFVNSTVNLDVWEYCLLKCPSEDRAESLRLVLTDALRVELREKMGRDATEREPIHEDAPRLDALAADLASITVPNPAPVETAPTPSPEADKPTMYLKMSMTAELELDKNNKPLIRSLGEAMHLNAIESAHYHPAVLAAEIIGILRDAEQKVIAIVTNDIRKPGSAMTIALPFSFTKEPECGEVLIVNTDISRPGKALAHIVSKENFDANFSWLDDTPTPSTPDHNRFCQCISCRSSRGQHV